MKCNVLKHESVFYGGLMASNGRLVISDIYYYPPLSACQSVFLASVQSSPQVIQVHRNQSDLVPSDVHTPPPLPEPVAAEPRSGRRPQGGASQRGPLATCSFNFHVSCFIEQPSVEHDEFNMTATS